jgi:hypothetical protein
MTDGLANSFPEGLIPYGELPGFAEVYLEDSWVLAVRATPARIEFDMEFVLREGHPLYEPPSSGEQYCYHRGRLTIDNVKSLNWTDQGSPPAVDASGELDFGNIDALFVGGGQVRAEGLWGSMVAWTDTTPAIHLDP